MTQNGAMIHREVVFSPRFLDSLRDVLDEWSTSLFDPASGGFRSGLGSDVDLLSSADMIWIRYAANSADPGAPDRARILGYLQRAQDPLTGRISYHSRGQGHSDGHAFWMVVRALAILGGQLSHFPAYQQPMMTAEGLASWFDGIDWSRVDRTDPRRSNHHEVLALIPVVASITGLADVFLQKIGEQQDPISGTWPRGKTSISRTFAYSAVHLAAGKLPRHPDRIVSEMLRLQNASGTWDRELPGYATMDAAYLLVRLPPRIGHRQADATAALRKLSSAMRTVFAEEQPAFFANPHQLLAVVHTFGLLQEAFPDEYPAERSYRFDWDKLEMYVCDVIRQIGNI